MGGECWLGGGCKIGVETEFLGGWGWKNCCFCGVVGR